MTSGTFSLDGGTWEVDNNVWVYGDEDEVAVIDAAHDVLAIAHAVRGRRVKAILCTHAHDDHVNVALKLSHELDAPVLLHPDDRVLWDMPVAATCSPSGVAVSSRTRDTRPKAGAYARVKCCSTRSQVAVLRTSFMSDLRELDGERGDRARQLQYGADLGQCVICAQSPLNTTSARSAGSSENCTVPLKETVQCTVSPSGPLVSC